MIKNQTSNLQDLLLYVNNGIGKCMNTINSSVSCEEQEKILGEDFNERIRKHVLESTFSTLTNVNFNEDRIADYIYDSCSIRDEIKSKFAGLLNVEGASDDSQSASNYQFNKNYDKLLRESIDVAGLSNRRHLMQDDDCFGLRECAHYGLKGAMAYFAHAESLREMDNSLYATPERSDLFNQFWSVMNDLEVLDKDLTFYLGLCLKIGEINVKVLELLDRSHTQLFGNPEPTMVSNIPKEGKCILLSGHDILDVKRMLDFIKSEGLEDKINVYTHGELLPAHSYPELKNNYSKNLIGHFGSAWQNQPWEFREFKGPIIMTSNCLMPPRRRYRERLFTTNAVGYDNIKHVNMTDKSDLKKIVDCALGEKGFENDDIEQYKMNSKNSEGEFLTGFGHAALLSKADVILNAIKGGDLKDIFIIGGCDGTEKNRSYFTELAKNTPENSIILTLGCGKYRLTGLELGNLGDSGIPRILDLGQCNDSYSAVVVATKLAEALNTDINQLPLHFAVSWFEQKAVAVFLSLLHLGIKNIRLGPALPGFLTPNVRQYLTENLGVRQVNMDDELDDLQEMLKERP